MRGGVGHTTRWQDRASVTIESIIIRRATWGDADAIWDIRTRAIRELCCTSYTEREIAAWASSPMPSSFQEVIRNTEFFVAEHESKIVGHAFMDPSTREIAAVFVSPDYVRVGIGSRLLASLEQRAQAIGLTSVWLSATLNATSFYSAWGYIEVEPSQYEHPDGFTLACVRMEKAFEPAGASISS